MFKQYYRLTKPGIIYGNLVYATAGFLLASNHLHHFNLVRLIAVLSGTALVIGSACVFNNLIDRKIDAKMKRTKKRALVTGAISTYNALSYAATLGFFGFIILATWTNWLTVYLGFAAFVIYVVIYGWAKRNTVHSTVIGSFAGAIPPVAGYCALANKLDAGAILLFLILVCWQMPHFYAIAIYRLDDYKAAGLPILTVKKGIAAAKKQILAYIIAFTAVVILLTTNGYTGYTFSVVMVCLSFYWIYQSLKGFNSKDSAKWARQMFFYSLIMTLCLSLMLAIGGLLP